jgi:succinoglycan biosynthesis transport protein ExoP
MESHALSFSDLLGLARRRFAVFANTFVASLSFTVLLAFGLPSVYESTGTILIEQQNIPDDLVQSTITSYADERIQVISQRVMSTDNLAGLVQRHELYGYGQDDESIVAKVTELKDAIVIEPISADVFNQSSGRPGQATIAFMVTVRNKTPEVARDLATEVTDLFLEENKRSRAAQTIETVSFLESQSVAYQGEIDRIDGEIADFKSKYQGMLPENMSFNLQSLDRVERQLIEIRGEIRTLEERIRYLQDERRLSLSESGGAVDRMAELQEEFARVSAKYAPNHPDVLNIRREIEILRQVDGANASADSAVVIVQVRQELALARERYSADHPDVRSLERTLAALVAQNVDGGSNSVLVTSPEVRQIDSEIREKNAVLSGLKQTQEALGKEIASLEKEMQREPEVERLYKMLSRRYEDAVERHDDIQAKLATARMSSQLETEQLGERFTPIDQPRLPRDPASPNRVGILALGMVLAGALSIAALALAEVLDSSVRNSRDVRELLGVPPLASIPVVETHSDRRNRFLRIFTHAAFAGLMISGAAAGILYLSA